MTYKIYKLEFNNYVHFGGSSGAVGLDKGKYTLESDSFFSALCIEILKIFDESVLAEFIDLTRNKNFLLSDLMPFEEDELYLPKPIIYYEREYQEDRNSSILKKKIKKLEYIKITQWKQYIDFIKNGGEFPLEEKKLVKNNLTWKNTLRTKKGAEPYVVDGYKFKKDSGLYFIVKIDEDFEEKFDIIMDSLKTTGIGGKKSIGYGKFDYFEDPYNIILEDNYYLYKSDKILKEMIKNNNSDQMLLSTVLPAVDEIEEVKNGYYSIVKRSGFITSGDYLDKFVKRKEVMMLKSGSCFKTKLDGKLIDLSSKGSHPIYRNGLAFNIGVDLNE